METKDSVGNILNDGDTVIITKTLNVELVKVNWLLKLSLLRKREF